MADSLWIIFCRDCEEEREADEVDHNYRCKTCGKIWEAESVTVYNPFIVEHYRSLFRGAKIAGAVPDPELEGDIEQMKVEQW